MKKYFLHDGNQQYGPYDLNELQARGISKYTQVWHEGLESWTNAENIEELRVSFKPSPPPFPQSPPKTKSSGGMKKRRVVRSIFIILASVVFIFVTLVIIGLSIENAESQPQKESYKEKVMSLEDIELATPTDFLKISSEYQENFWGDKIIINGIITSLAKVSTFKDVVVRVKYLSKTNTIMFSKDYRIYELINPQSSVEFELRVENHDDVNNVELEIVSAEPNR